MTGQFSEFHLKRSPAGILLNLQSKFAEEGFIAHNLDFHGSFAAAHHRAAIRIMRIEQIFNLVMRGIFPAGLFYGFLGFSVQRSLRDFERTFDDFAVRGNLVACLQKDKIAYDNLTDMYFRQTAVPDHLCHLLGLFLGFQRGSLALLTAFTER